MRYRRLWIGLGIAVLLPACEEGWGERATDGCPPYERCSPETPKGLRFSGAPVATEGFEIGRDEPPATAVGGIQRIALWDLAHDRGLDAGWRAELEGELESVGQERNHVTVRGAADGSADLRIVDADSDELFDRTTLFASPVAGVAAFSRWENHADRDRPVAWLAGAPIDVAIGLASATGAALVDEGLAVRLVDGATSVARRGEWYEVVIDGTPPGQRGAVTLAVDAGDQRDLPVTLPVVDAIDEVVVGATQLTDQLEVGGAAGACFEGHRGGFTVDGLDWTVEVRGDAGLQRSLFGVNCWMVTPHAPGPVTIVATAAGHTVELTMTAAPAPPGGS